MRKNSVKYVRVNQAIQKEVSNIIRNEVKDPRVGLLTSVTAAEVTTDLKSCKIYISVLGDEKEKDDTMLALRRAEGFIRRQLAANLNLRNTPELTFLADNSIEYGMNMSELIDSVVGKDTQAEKERAALEEADEGNADE